MAVPIAARDVAAVAGALLVLTAAFSVVGTLMVPRPVASRLTRWVDVIVNGAFTLITRPIASYKRRDRILAAQAAAILLGQLATWLLISFIGYTLLVWPFTSGGITSAVTLAGPAVFGPNDALGAAERIIADLAAGTALIIVTLQIAYLPTLYSAFNRREDEVSLLNARAGVPSWGPELLARTHYALGSGTSTIDTLPDLYQQWEGWAADLAESHTTYLPLVRFRSPRPLSSWVTSLLAVLDSAALYLALAPQSAPVVPARLCLRSGFVCLASGSPSATRNSSMRSPGCARWTSPSSATLPKHGRNSSAGGSTMNWPPTPWLTPSMPYRRCGRARAVGPHHCSRRSARRPAGPSDQRGTAHLATGAQAPPRPGPGRRSSAARMRW